MAASLKEFGWRQPIVVDKDGVIVAGHTRLAAAKQLGLEQVPVHVAGDLTPEQIRGYRLMDNRSNEETSWDSAVLSMELGELKGLGFDMTMAMQCPPRRIPRLPSWATVGFVATPGAMRRLDLGRRRSAAVCAGTGQPGVHRPPV